MSKSVPRIPQAFFKWYCRSGLQESILGDLEEEFEQDQRARGAFVAKARFTWNIIRFFRKGIRKPISGTHKLNTYGMYKHYLKIGWRSILQSKFHSLINILGLATGATVCLITFLFYQYETTFDQHHAKADRTYRVVQHTQRADQEFYWNTTAFPLAAALRNDFPSFEHVTQIAGPMTRVFSIEGSDKLMDRIEDQYVLFADSEFPKVFDFEWLAGNPETALKELNSVVINERTAAKCFGMDTKPITLIGKTFMLNNKDPLTITGVVKNQVPNSTHRFNLLVPYEFFKINNPFHAGNWSGNYSGTTFIVTSEEDTENIEKNISAWKSKYLNENDDKQISYRLQPIKDMHNDTLYGSSPRGYQIDKGVLNTSLIVALFILLIAIVNFINMVTARATTRAKEVAVRKTLGSNRLSLIQQFLLENSILVLLSMGIAVVVTYSVLAYINVYLSHIHMQLSLNLVNVSFVLVACLSIIFLATLYPALVLSSFSPIKGLSRSKESNKKIRFSGRKSLSLLQLTIMQFFVICALIVGLQTNLFKATEAGFDSEKVVMISLHDHKVKEPLMNQLLANSQITKAAVGSGPPMAVESFQLGTTFRLSHQSKLDGVSAEMKVIDNNYLDLYDIPLIAGRNFLENRDPFDEFIVNERVIKTFGWSAEEAIGKKMRVNEGEAVIVGVVGDFHNLSLQNESTPVVLMNWGAFQWNVFLKITSYEQLAFIEDTWQSFFPQEVYSVRFLNETIEREYILESLIFTGFNILSALVIGIGALGILGLMSFVNLQKTKEIGIRKVLGATASNIVGMLSSEFAVLVGIGFLIAAPVAYFLMSQWLDSFAYRIPLTVWIFLAGGGIILLISLGIATSKAWNAARANPVESLKYE